MTKKYKKLKIRIGSKNGLKLEKELEKLETYIRKIEKKNANGDKFELVLSAALVKTFECCVASVKIKESDIFFLIASLRGICEDFISLKFIYEYLP
jgi:hypothetical protein